MVVEVLVMVVAVEGAGVGAIVLHPTFDANSSAVVMWPKAQLPFSLSQPHGPVHC